MGDTVIGKTSDYTFSQKLKLLKNDSLSIRLTVKRPHLNINYIGRTFSTAVKKLKNTKGVMVAVVWIPSLTGYWIGKKYVVFLQEFPEGKYIR